MTWVKICGTTNIEDAMMVVDAGADALGFVFYEKSPRYVDPEAVREMISKLPERIEKVGIFVDQSPEQMHAVAKDLQLTALQMVTTAWPPSPQPAGWDPTAFGGGVRVYVSLPADQLIESGTQWVVSSSDPPKAESNLIGAIFLDSGTTQKPGGTGKVFDWKRAEPLVKSMRKSVNVVIAGGLTPSNVAEAMRILRPWGVDVASGVEARPGKKDPQKVRAFIAAVREADKQIRA